MQERYAYYSTLFSNFAKPLAFLDKDLLDLNIAGIVARNPNKKMRVASKSIRCVDVLKYILQDEEHFEGIMSFTGEETTFLLEKGFDNILIGYPIINHSQIEELCKYIAKGKKVIFMIDLKEHISIINKIAAANKVVAEICIDIDMSSRFPFLYFGVYRSAITHLEKLKEIAGFIKTCPHVKLTGLMGYESQIAGLGDNTPGNGLKNWLIRLLKKQSIKQLKKWRKEAVEYLIAEGFDLEIINGGGTGSIETTAQEKYITEITVGSGFFSPHLFDNYQHFKHEPAVAYMVEITRHPQKNIFTSTGGGYTASGAMDKNKLPKPFLPQGVGLIANEGAGEVQTPIKYRGNNNLKIGDAIIMRHSKAGELCERFNHLYVVADNKIIGQYLTYRGEGKCFL